MPAATGKRVKFVRKTHLSKQAKAYWLAIVVAGFALLVITSISWRPQTQELPRLGLYILAALATSGLKVRLPGIFSTLSIAFRVATISLMCA